MVVRAQGNIETVRRRLMAIAQTHDASPPVALNETDTVITLTGPELELRAWRCALALREQLLGEATVRIICSYVGSGNESMSGAVGAMLERAPWNFVYALRPLADRVEHDNDDAGLWALHEPRVDALVYPASEFRDAPDAEFAKETLPELPRYAIRASSDGSCDYSSFVDDDGFLNIARATEGGAVPVLSAILSSKRVLVAAPPWTGKTFVAKGALQRIRHPNRFVHLTELEDPDHGVRYAPHDWLKWQASQRELIWLIDSVDEALHRGETLDALRERLSALQDGAKERLRLVLFARDDDTKARVVHFFAELKQPLEVFQLLPVDRTEAARSVKANAELGAHDFESILTRLRSAQLGAWSTHLPMLIRTARIPPEVHSSELREQLLEALCVESEARVSGSHVSSRELLRVAAHAAAVMSIAKIETFADGQPGHAGVGALFRSSDQVRAFRVLTRSGPLLLRTPGGYRFRQEHAKELLAAQALKDVRLPVLRQLMTDYDGRLRPDLSEVARQIPFQHGEGAERVDSWRTTKLRPWAPKFAIDRLHQAEQLAIQIWPSTSIPTARLDHPQTRAYLLGRVRSRRTAAMARKLYFDVARRGGWREFVPIALKVAREATAPEVLRDAAVYLVIELGSPLERTKLEPLMQETEATSPAARARFLQQKLEEGADALQVAARMPLPERGLTDYRSFLVSAVEERLLPEHARVVLDSYRGVTSEALTQARASELLDRSVEVLLNEERLTPADIERVVHVLNSHENQLWSKYHAPFKERLKSDSDARRSSYLLLRGQPKYWEYSRLHAEDATWLLERLERGDAPAESWKDLAQFVYHSELPQPVLSRALRHLELRHADEFAAGRVRAAEDARILAEHARPRAAERSRPSRQWLGDLVTSTLSSEEHPQQRIHELGALCFGSTNVPSVDGTFEALAAALKQQTIDHAKRLFMLAEPVALPNQGGGYSSAIRLEGDVFRAVVTWEDPASWLTGELIRRWLPSSLFTSAAGQTEATWRCEMIDADATEVAVISALEAEAKARDFPVFVKEVSCQLWERPALRRRAHSLIRSSEVSLAFRSELLRKLSSHCWVPAMRRLAQDLAASGEKGLRIAAVSSLFEHDPERALAYLDESWSDEELAEALEPFTLWTRNRVSFDAWSLKDIERLLLVLAARDLIKEPRDVGIISFVGPAERLRGVLSRVQERLHMIQDASHFERVVEKVEGVSPDLAAELRSTDASYKLMRLFQDPPFDPPSVRDVADALDGTRSPRFRNEDDFAETLLACIDVLSGDSKEHVQLFSAGVKPRESLLQTYVMIRLRDLLARREPHNVVFTPREPNMGPTEPDWLATAEGEQSSRLEIFIEAKWSDSAEIFTGLEKQLAADYILRSRLTHGIYIVGFTGLGPHADQTLLKDELERRVASLQAVHPEVRLDVRLLDLSPLNARKRNRPRKLTAPREVSAIPRPTEKRVRARSSAATGNRIPTKLSRGNSADPILEKQKPPKKKPSAQTASKGRREGRGASKR